MTALPQELPPWLTHNATIMDAYAIGLRFEKSAQTHPDSKRIMYARILGYLLLYGPSDQARVVVAREVVSCVDEDELSNNGKMYLEHFIRPLKMTKEDTPTSSSDDSRGCFDPRRLVGTPQSHQDAKAYALIRDGFRCVVTGYYEIGILLRNEEMNKTCEEEGGSAYRTRCAYIFGQPTNRNISGESGDSKWQCAAGAWAVLHRFGYKIDSELNGNLIHRLENVMTVDASIRGMFGRMWLWFEATDTPNSYKLETIRPKLFPPFWRRIVTFTTLDPDRLPVPSPQYLEIHAACARVAHFSGAGDYIDMIHSDLEDLKVLSEDGSSADAIEYALSSLSLAEPATGINTR